MALAGTARRVLERGAVVRSSTLVAIIVIVGLLAIAATAIGASGGAPVSVSIHGPVQVTSPAGLLAILPVVFQGIAVVVALPTLGAIF